MSLINLVTLIVKIAFEELLVEMASLEYLSEKSFSIWLTLSPEAISPDKNMFLNILSNSGL